MPKQVLLIGAGHSNIQLLHRLAQLDLASCTVKVLSDVTQAPYSGMIPSYLAGAYDFSDLHFDIEKICRRFGVQFMHASAIKINASERSVETSVGQTVSYDICSIDIGIRPRGIAADGTTSTHIIYLKPISQMIEKWRALALIEQTPKLKITIVGGGAAAFEIAVACRRKYPSQNVGVCIITGQSGLLEDLNGRAQKLARQCLGKLRIDLIEGQRVERIDDDSVVLNNSSVVQSDICLIATSAEAPSIFRKSELPISSGGFVKVTAQLNVEGYVGLFATGDCCHFTPYPLTKSGVFAVRQGPVLTANILASIADKPLVASFRPQRRWLKILVSGDNTAIAVYGPLAFEGRLAWLLKD